MTKIALLETIKRVAPSLVSICNIQESTTRSLPTINLKNAQNCKYAVKIFNEHELIIVVNAERHRIIKDAGKSSVNISKLWAGLPKGSNVLEPHYKELGKKGSDNWEKIWFVGFEYLESFFHNIEIWFLLNRADKEFKGKKDSFDSEDDRLRERCSYERWKRDQRFRRLVLERYNKKCAICECDIEDVLEAAHERGYEVKDTNYDDPAHGICLCRIHHRLYDKGMIDIDLGTFSIPQKGEKLKKSQWFKDFCEIGQK